VPEIRNAAESATELSRYVWTDAWLLLAIRFAAGDDMNASLASTFQLADAIEHAMPTKDEMDGAIGRLSRAEYIQYANGTVAILEAGRILVERSAHGARNVRDQQQAIERELNAMPWSEQYHPSSARAGEAEFISSGEWDRLMAPYRE